MTEKTKAKKSTAKTKKVQDKKTGNNLKNINIEVDAQNAWNEEIVDSVEKVELMSCHDGESVSAIITETKKKPRKRSKAKKVNQQEMECPCSEYSYKCDSCECVFAEDNNGNVVAGNDFPVEELEERFIELNSKQKKDNLFIRFYNAIVNLFK